jgi:hypothetical protein
VSWIKHSFEKKLAKGASAIGQPWNADCEHPLTIDNGRVDNSESSYLDLFYLFIKVRREVVVPRAHTSHAYSRKDRSTAPR